MDPNENHNPHGHQGRGPDPPARAAGVELLGEMAGSGYQQAPLLVRRADGQTVQLTPLLYALLEAIDGRRGWEELAMAVSARAGRQLTAADVVYLLAVKLRPLGLLRGFDGSEPQTKRVNPLLGLRFRLVVTNERVTNGLAGLFAWLFHPVVVAPVAVAFAAVCCWAFAVRGLAAAIDDALFDPRLVLVVVALTIVSAAFHELGHAAACRYGGATPRAMGAALYLLWPVFYTDVTDSYRLGRAGRLRVDLGGLYFNAIFTLGTVAAWALTGAEGLLVVVPIQVFQMARQLIPLVRFDGYHILADLTGVPDLFARIRPVLASMVPFRRRLSAGTRVRARELKPWARVVVTAWVVVVVPALALMFGAIVWHLPRVAVGAWESLGAQWQVLRDSYRLGDADRVALGLVAMFAVAIAPASMAYLATRVGRTMTVRAWTFTEDRPFVRAAAGVAVIALAVSLAPSWWPDGGIAGAGRDGDGISGVGGEVREPGFAGVVPQVVELASQPVSSRKEAAVVSPSEAGGGHVGRVHTERIVATPPPSPPAPVVRDAAEPNLRIPASGTVRYRPAWPFPFDPPPAAGADDNHAVAVGRFDDNVEVVTAFALDWHGDTPVAHGNRAYALASCYDCRTVAVAFQAVIADGMPHTVVPENLAVATSYECQTCVTQAVAVQLVVTLTRPLDAATRGEVTRLFAQARAIHSEVAYLSAAEVRSRLVAVKAEMLAVLAPFAEPVGGGAEDGDAGLAEEEGDTLTEPADPADGAVADGAVAEPGGSDGAMDGGAAAEGVDGAGPTGSDAVDEADATDATDVTDDEGLSAPEGLDEEVIDSATGGTEGTVTTEGGDTTTDSTGTTATDDTSTDTATTDTTTTAVTDDTTTTVEDPPPEADTSTAA